MPETYGLPEPEPTREEQAQRVVNEVVAGQSVVRTVVLYVLVGICVLTPAPVFAILPLIMLLASDPRMSS